MVRMIALLVFLVLFGCATPKGKTTYDYSPPTELHFKHEAIIKKPFQDVWDMLVGELSRSFYVVNNIAKDSRIIAISLSSARPSEYADCGKYHMTYTQGSRNVNYDHLVTESKNYKHEAQEQESDISYYVIRRKTNLDARASVQVSPVQGNPEATKVTIKSRYNLEIAVKGERIEEDSSGASTFRGYLREDKSNISFETTKPGYLDVAKVPLPYRLICYCKGKIEEDIINMVNK